MVNPDDTLISDTPEWYRFEINVPYSDKDDYLGGLTVDAAMQGLGGIAFMVEGNSSIPITFDNLLALYYGNYTEPTRIIPCSYPGDGYESNNDGDDEATYNEGDTIKYECAAHHGRCRHDTYPHHMEYKTYCQQNGTWTQHELECCYNDFVGKWRFYFSSPKIILKLNSEKNGGIAVSVYLRSHAMNGYGNSFFIVRILCLCLYFYGMRCHV